MTHTMIPRTNYLMEQEPSLIQAQAGGDGGWYCWQDKMAEKEKKGPPGPCSGKFIPVFFVCPLAELLQHTE
jgi:hypothetical protein